MNRRLPDDLHAMTYADMRWWAHDHHILVRSYKGLSDTMEGMYDDETQTILLELDMTYTMKRCTLAHELVHWAYGDDTCEGPYGAKLELRCRRETARRLIPIPEYAFLEHEYDGDVFHIANDLDATMAIIRDFQRYVIPRDRNDGDRHPTDE